jgi:hypothetical protein
MDCRSRHRNVDVGRVSSPYNFEHNIQILNQLGIFSVYGSSERCCGQKISSTFDGNVFLLTKFRYMRLKVFRKWTTKSKQ